MKTGQDAIAICGMCSSKVPMGELRYNWKIGDFVCQGCFQGKKVERKETIVKLPNQKRVKYICEECGYEFSRSEGFQISKLCFFCGKEGVIQEDKKKPNIVREV